jgi:hypothetical protein
VTAWIKRRTFLGSRLRLRRGILHRGRSSALILSLQAPPVFRRRHDQLENHEPRRVLRERAFHAHRAMPNRRKGAFNRIRCPQMRPMFGREIEERHRGVGDSAVSESQISRRPDARWAEPTSAACRERSGSCAASIVGDGSRERLRPGPSKSRAPRRPPRCQARSTDPAPLDRNRYGCPTSLVASG